MTGLVRRHGDGLVRCQGDGSGEVFRTCGVLRGIKPSLFHEVLKPYCLVSCSVPYEMSRNLWCYVRF